MKRSSGERLGRVTISIGVAVLRPHDNAQSLDRARRHVPLRRQAQRPQPRDLRDRSGGAPVGVARGWRKPHGVIIRRTGPARSGRPDDRLRRIDPVISVTTANAVEYWTAPPSGGHPTGHLAYCRRRCARRKNAGKCLPNAPSSLPAAARSASSRRWRWRVRVLRSRCSRPSNGSTTIRAPRPRTRRRSKIARRPRPGRRGHRARPDRAANSAVWDRADARQMIAEFDFGVLKDEHAAIPSSCSASSTSSPTWRSSGLADLLMPRSTFSSRIVDFAQFDDRVEAEVETPIRHPHASRAAI